MSVFKAHVAKVFSIDPINQLSLYKCVPPHTTLILTSPGKCGTQVDVSVGR